MPRHSRLGRLGLEQVPHRLADSQLLDLRQEAGAAIHAVVIREIGDHRGEGNALGNLASALYDLEEKDRAIHLMEEALEIYEAIEAPDAEDARAQIQEWGALP